MTSYLILKYDDGTDEEEGTWSVIVSAKASSAQRALKAAAVGEGEYVAIPERSWKPLTVKVEQTTKVTIGG